MDEERSGNCSVQNRDRAGFSWCCSLEWNNVRRSTDGDVAGSCTIGPSVLPAREAFQEQPPGTLKHEVSLNGRNPLELRRQSVLGSCPIGRSLGYIFHATSQYPQGPQKGMKPTRRILGCDFLEFIIIHIWKVVAVDILLELRIGPSILSNEDKGDGIRSTQKCTHVTLVLAKLKRVPSSSQFPETAGISRSTVCVGI